jgi:molybdenum cofactor sulfurtransferase
MFGFPTGLGALIVRRDSLDFLIKAKRYFGGGTVAMHLVEDFNVCHFKKSDTPEEVLEDGTLPFQQVFYN